MLKSKTCKSISLAGLVLSGLLLAGCNTAPRTASFQDDSSWAFTVSSATNINPNGRMLNDADSLEQLEGPADVAKYSLNTTGFAAAHAFNSTSLMLLDLLATPSTPDLPLFFHTTLAWFPADQAKSAEDARDQFHTMRMEAIKEKLDSVGAKYRLKSSSPRKKVIAGPIYRFDQLIMEDGVPGLCEQCTIAVATALPDKKPVMAPKELTGESFLAYRFGGSKEQYFRTYTTLRWGIPNPWQEGKYIIWESRNFEHVEWLVQAYPEWAAEYVPVYKPERYRFVLSGELPNDNPFPFMAHKGQIKHFVKGHQ